MKPTKTELRSNIKKAMIQLHGQGLIRFFGLDPKLVDPVQLCKKLRRLETQAHRITTQLCNGFPELDHDMAEDHIAELEIKLCQIEGKVCDLLESHYDEAPRNKQVKLNGIFINRDPRGYALKVSDKVIKDCAKQTNYADYFPHTDWGGYGVLAPDLTYDIENEVNYISTNWKELTTGNQQTQRQHYEAKGFIC